MIASFVRLDLSSWFPRTQTLLTLGLVVVVGVLLPIPGMAIVAAAMVTSLMVSAPFLGDERGRLDTLYGLLPVSRRTVVVGRALSICSYFIVAIALATVVTLITAAARDRAVAGEILLIALAVAFAFVGLALALQLPVLFRIGYSRGRLMAYAPALVVAGLAWLLQAIGVQLPFQQALEGAPVALIGGAGVLIGLAGILCGVLVATRLYRTKEL